MPCRLSCVVKCRGERRGQSSMPHSDSSSSVYTESGISRVCVMEVEAVNGAEVGLQVKSHHPTQPACVPNSSYQMTDPAHEGLRGCITGSLGIEVRDACRCGWASA